jgi:hypothetical protein
MRLLLLILLLLNTAYFAWAHGLLLGLGLAPVAQGEPQRLGQQIKPEAVRRISERELKPLEAAPVVAPKPAECLRAGLFEEAQEAPLRQALEALTLPPGAWALEPVLEPGHWILYMGKFANAETLAKKRAELTLLKLKFERVNNAALEPGLSLGGFESQEAADAALDTLARRGVRTARVVQERAEVRALMLRLPAVDDTLRSRLSELKPALAGKELSTCDSATVLRK